ncbi:aldehyde dehydrogenase [Flavisolibacter tropicus]|nr:aldehyde dehydrogenase [Flavisolibacter tropicus]
MDRALQLQEQQTYFASGATHSYAFRKEQLEKLKAALYQHEEAIYDALAKDLKKNKEEAWVTEIGFTVAEINYALKHLKKWMRPKRVGTNLLNFPGKSFILPEPLGVVLIISPWNYPVQLLLSPLVGAIAAGNCVVLKPSEFAPATASILETIITETFDQRYISIIQGDGATVIPQMMNNFRFDHVFYTGSTQIGTVIYEMAAKKLVPVTLELGGKSPCIIEKDANLKIAAKRIALTKFSNAGQMCVAPDYLLLHVSIKDAFLKELKQQIGAFYNTEGVRDYHFGKIVNDKSFHRLTSYIQKEHVIYGGRIDAATHFIEPTLLDNPPLDAPVMQEEIFGPLLPVLTWEQEEDVYRIIRTHKNPLALYVFTSSNDRANHWLKSIPFGGGCINNASWHLTNHQLPFGGRGTSGIGAYHGRFSFDTFSHQKGIMKTATWLDPAIKYPPFKGKLNLFKKLIK